MNTNLKAILTAISLATLASPVMAQSLITRPDVGESAAHFSNPYGAVAGVRREHMDRMAPVTRRDQIHTGNAVHVPFPQQDGGN
jgi:hypothetical protein